jgi:amidophosphoribosyltransferase
VAELREKCAVFGVYGADVEAARLAYYGLYALQHRGQEGSGIVSSDGNKLYSHIAPGLVAHVYSESDLERLPGHLAIGHNRYSTSGGGGGEHTQPVLMPEINFAFGHNGNLPSTEKLEVFLCAKGLSIAGKNDSALMAAAIAYYLRDGLSLEAAVVEAYPLFTGAFSCVATDGTKVVAFRDQCGIRPLSIGQLEDGYVVSSETCAMDTVGAAFLREVKPGELVVLDEHGLTSHQIVKGNQKLDIFEFIYFARPDSILLGKRVNEVRRRFGINLAREHKIEADVVIAIPDSAIPAALGYAQESGIPFDHGLIKNRYIHRTFIRPAQNLRRRDVQMKLNPIPETLMGKRVVVIDDSLVRGTTSKEIIKMLYGAGAKSVHLLISSPPVRFPDFYGIDTPKQTDLVAATMTVEETRAHIGSDSLGYLSYEGMIKATGRAASSFSTSCFNGVYPIDIGDRARSLMDTPGPSGRRLFPVAVGS